MYMSSFEIKYMKLIIFQRSMRLRFHGGPFDSGKTMTVQPGLFDTQPLFPGWKLLILKLLRSSSGAFKKSRNNIRHCFHWFVGIS